MPRVLRTTIMTLLLIACAAAPAIGQTGGQNRGGPVRDHQRLIQRHVKSWLELRRENIVVQKRDYSCGAAALATLVRYYWGDQVTEEMVLRDLDKMLTREEALDRVKNGLTLTDLRRVAVRAGVGLAAGALAGLAGVLDGAEVAVDSDLVVAVTDGLGRHLLQLGSITGQPGQQETEAQEPGEGAKSAIHLRPPRPTRRFLCYCLSPRRGHGTPHRLRRAP